MEKHTQLLLPSKTVNSNLQAEPDRQKLSWTQTIGGGVNFNVQHSLLQKMRRNLKTEPS